MKVVLFYHSIVSDWNHGNAHFLRGVARELIARGHEVRVYEPRDGWSRQNLVAEHGTQPVEEFDPDKWEAVLQVNLTGTFNVTRLAIPYLKKSAAGSIIIMSSLGGRYGYPNRAAYCTTKWGLIGFAKTLSIELGAFNIRANAIAPGAVEGTRIHNVIQGRADAAHESFDDAMKEATSIQSLKRFVDPKDIAALAVFLASDAGKSISGQVLPIDNDSLKAS